MARRRKGLGKRHKRILEVFEKFQEEHGYPPSIREIGKAAKISSTSVVNYYLDQLEEAGYIERDRNVSRGIRLLKTLTDGATATAERARSSAGALAETVQQSIEDLLRIPIAGRIVASEPVPVPPSDFAYYDAESMVEVARSLLPVKEKTDELFALEVDGNSMIDAMVNDGDLVIMRPAQEARNGEMVAVFLRDKDETTLKYFYLENGRVRLQPANPEMDPIFVDDPTTVEIQGKVVMVIRQVATAAI